MAMQAEVIERPGLAGLPEFLTVRQVAAFVNCSTSTVWRAVWSHDLPSVRLTGTAAVRVSRGQLEAWLRSKEGAA
jgi:excisionase family DNA binding protein